MKTKSIIYVLVIVVAIVIVFFAVLDLNRRDYKLHDNVNNNIAPVATSTKPVVKPLNVQISDIGPYYNINVLKDGSSLFVTTFATFENEYFPINVYQVNTETSVVTKLDTSFIAKENGLIVGAKLFPFDTIENYKDGKFVGYINDAVQLATIAKQTNIPQADLKGMCIGGKPSCYVVVKNIYNKGSNSMILTTTQTQLPVYNYDANRYEWNGQVYPGTDFIKLSNEDKNYTITKGGYTFTYNASTKVLNIK